MQKKEKENLSILKNKKQMQEKAVLECSRHKILYYRMEGCKNTFLTNNYMPVMMLKFEFEGPPLTHGPLKGLLLIPSHHQKHIICKTCQQIKEDTHINDLLKMGILNTEEIESIPAFKNYLYYLASRKEYYKNLKKIFLMNQIKKNVIQ